MSEEILTIPLLKTTSGHRDGRRIRPANSSPVFLQRLSQLGLVFVFFSYALLTSALECFEERDAVRVYIQECVDAATERHPFGFGYIGGSHGETTSNTSNKLDRVFISQPARSVRLSV